MQKTAVYLFATCCLLGLGYFRDVRVIHEGQLVESWSWNLAYAGLLICLVISASAVRKLRQAEGASPDRWFAHCDFSLPILVSLPFLYFASTTDTAVHGDMVIAVTHGWGAGPLHSLYFLAALVTALLADAAFFRGVEPPVITTYATSSPPRIPGPAGSI